LYAKLSKCEILASICELIGPMSRPTLVGGKALMVAIVWLAGMFAPLGAKTLVQLPNWVAITWMIGWALLGYIFAPYKMWEAQRKK
ncbi:MAG: hypothetical protein WCD13_04910, partial [Pseudolabrys sp.]